MTDRQFRPGEDHELKVHDGIVGAIILLSVVAGMMLNPAWFWLAGLTGAIMLSSAFTGFVRSTTCSASSYRCVASGAYWSGAGPMGLERSENKTLGIAAIVRKLARFDESKAPPNWDVSAPQKDWKIGFSRCAARPSKG